MEIFGYTIIETCELRRQRLMEKDEHNGEINRLKKKIAELENKVYHQRFQIEQAEDAKNRAQRDMSRTETLHLRLCKDYRHLEAELERIKKRYGLSSEK